MLEFDSLFSGSCMHPFKFQAMVVHHGRLLG
jgi:hypothetical protein